MTERCWCEGRKPDLVEDVWWSTVDGRVKLSTSVFRVEAGREHYRVKTATGSLHHDGAVFEFSMGATSTRQLPLRESE